MTNDDNKILKQPNPINNDNNHITSSSTHENSKLTPEESFTSLEIYPRVIDSHLSQISFCNIKYKRIGNTLAFGFNSSGVPIFVIGPHWPLYLVLITLINTICLLVYNKLLCHFLNTLATTAFFIIYIGLQLNLTMNVIINPGIIYREESYNQIGNYCQECNAFIKEGVVASHCMLCNVCIENLDHHCVWVGKCIGKQSIKIFYSLIANLIVLYAHLIISIIYYFIKIK